MRTDYNSIVLPSKAPDKRGLGLEMYKSQNNNMKINQVGGVRRDMSLSGLLSEQLTTPGEQLDFSAG